MARDPRLIEERMAQGFLPDETVQLEFRSPRALEYIAFYMGRIDKKLERLIELMEQRQGG